jgi:hypothetical protein
MAQTEQILAAFFPRGRSLSEEFGVDEYAFDKSTSLELLEVLGEGQAVLGGDR